jgi:hypothetical protein
VPYTNAQARQQLLDTLAQATTEIGSALATLSEAYEHLDEQSAERLEEELFRPVQTAYGRAKRTHAEFAKRHELPGVEFASAPVASPSRDTRAYIDAAMDAVGRADGTLATLQDSMLPVEVGDAQLRAGLEDVRTLLGGLRGRAREFVRTLGR